MPLVSVIVLTYCQECTIARTLDSVLAQQTSFDFEIVIGEDGGTDGTRAICEDYARRYPARVLLMPKAANKGVVQNYFDTLMACRGEFIADCAGDDFWCDDTKLQRQVDMLTAHPEASAVHTGWYRYYESTGKKEYAERPAFGNDTVRSIALQTDYPVVHLCTALYRKNIIVEALSADGSLFLNPHWRCEDMQVAYALAKWGAVLYDPTPTLCYSMGHESVSNEGDDLKQYAFFLPSTDLVHEIVKRENLHGDDIDRFFQHRIYALLMHLLRADCPERLDELRTHAGKWQQSLSMKNRVLSFCIAHAPLRCLLRFIRRLVISIK